MAGSASDGRESRGQRVLDLGCGFGGFCRWAQENGAVRVVGVDISVHMLSRARVYTQSLGIEYEQGDLKKSFTLCTAVWLYTTFPHSARSLFKVRLALKAGGPFIFSVEHPIGTAPYSPNWQRNSDGHQLWLLEGYSDEGPRMIK